MTCTPCTYTRVHPSCAWHVHAHVYGVCTACTQAPRYFCVRLVWNGDFIHQLCDPNDAAGRTTGRVRAAVEEFWNDLERAHYIDSATRAVTLTV